jgi:hypothetical protein
MENTTVEVTHSYNPPASLACVPRAGTARTARNPVRSVPRILQSLLLLCVWSSSYADNWPGPQVREVFSESREYFVRIIPGESVGDTFGFAGAKKGKYSVAEFYHRGKDRSYQLTTEAVLLNPVAPVEFFVSNEGRLATLDNWHNLGYGEVVVLYDPRGQVIRSYELHDLFLSEEIAAFTQSTSSIRWRGGPTLIRPDQKTLLVTVESGGNFIFGLETGLYKYCEYVGRQYRCRNSNDGRQWQPNNEVPLLR